MCGRFTTTIDLEEIKRYFKIGIVEGEYTPLYNAAPSQNIPVVLGNQPRKLAFFRWGLVPSWSKEETIGNRMINARAETLAEKPGFRQAYQKRRCVIVADGFFEWGKNKRIHPNPYRVIMADRSPFAMAGLWETWSPPGKTPLYTCTIITTQANSLLQSFHDRMPVILSPENTGLWLDPSIQDPSLLNPLLKPYPPEHMALYAVSPLVNSPANNSPEVIKPIIKNKS